MNYWKEVEKAERKARVPKARSLPPIKQIADQMEPMPLAPIRKKRPGQAPKVTFGQIKKGR